MKILLTGGTGFLGSELLNKIKKNNQILLISRKKIFSLNKNLIFIKDDITLKKKSFDIIKNFSPEAVIHFAWEGIPNFSKKNCKNNFEKHKKFFLKILRIKSIKKIIVSGSCLEYDEKSGRCIESSKTNPSNYFGKYKNKLRIFIFKNYKNISICWMRIFYVFGQNQRKQSLIPYLIKCHKLKKRIVLKNLNCEHDFIYLDDVISGILKALLKRKTRGIFNLATGQTFSVEYVSDLVKNIFNKKKNIIKKFNPCKDFLLGDIRKSNKILKWSPKFSLKKGLLKTINNDLQN